MESKLMLDGNKLLHHLDHVNKWNRGEQIYPLYLAFALSEQCNHKCNFCVYSYKNFESNYLSLEKYEEILPELVKAGTKAIFFSGDGEPLLNPRSVEIIDITKKMSIDVALNTNGVLVKENNVEPLLKNLSWIRISINAGSPETYSTVHGTSSRDFHTVINNLKLMVETKKKHHLKTTIGVQFTVTKDNIHEVKKLAVIVREIGVDYLSVKPFLKHPKTQYNPIIQNLNVELNELVKLKSLSTTDFSFYIRESLFLGSNTREYSKCLSLPFMAEIDASGDMYTCGAHLGEKEFCYGNIFDHGYINIFDADQRKKVMNHVENNIDYNKRCMPNCRHHSVNNFLWSLKNSPDHVNFI